MWQIIEMDAALEAHFSTSRVLSRVNTPELVSAIDYALRQRQIEAVLPGIYAPTNHRQFLDVLIAALRLYEPTAVLLAQTAARELFHPPLRVDLVHAAVRRRLTPKPGYQFIRRTVPDELVVTKNGVRMVIPALAAIDSGPDVVDFALRERHVQLHELADAYQATKRWRGSADRSRLVEESTDNPWSAAERLFHRMLRTAGLTEWRGNYPIADHPVDVVFLKQRLAIEIDGRHFHGDAHFERDRWQQNATVLAGWRILRFTWTMLEKYPDRVMDTVHRALAL